MKITGMHSHRFAHTLVQHVPELSELWTDLLSTIEGISDDDIVKAFTAPNETVSDYRFWTDGRAVGTELSLSVSINNLLKQRLEKLGWDAESGIFQEPSYSKKSETRWRLDFSKTIPLADEDTGEVLGETGIAVEVAFNHGEAIAWNLLKPVMAAELNHVSKELHLGEGIGVVICASAELKKAGAFDSSVGEYEKFLRYLRPMRNQLTVPMMIIGLGAPDSFTIQKKSVKKEREKWGRESIGIVTLNA